MSTTNPPTVFISYSHEDKDLAHAFAAGLEAEGIKTWVDENELLPGDSIIEQVATAVQGVDFFCALVSHASRDSKWCQKELSLAMTRGLGREGATVMPLKVGDVEMPDSIKDLLYVELDPDNLTSAVKRITDGVHRHRQRRNTAGDKRSTQQETAEQSPPPRATSSETDAQYEPVRMVGVVKEGVSKPRNDGTRGSALYRVPLRLSRRPSAAWAELFVETWNHPPRYTNMHRTGIASIKGDTIVLDGTSMEELERYHVETLRGVLDVVNQKVEELESRERAERNRQAEAERSHQQTVDDIAGRLRFD